MSTSIDVTPTLFRVIKNASISQVITTICIILLVRWIVTAIYRVYFHPLSGFPGPKLSACTHIPQIIAVYTGTNHHYIGRLHREYGDIVRVGPEEVSFIDPQAWKDVYGHGNKHVRGAPPTKHWKRYGRSVSGHPSLINARDPEHARARRIFNPAFSDRALKQQEPLFSNYVNQLVRNIQNGIKEEPEHKFDMVRMYNFTTFDIMGDLTFGEPLHMLDNAEYDPWVGIIFASLKFSSRFSVTQHYPVLHATLKRLVFRTLGKKRLEHFQFSVDRVTKRLEQGRESEGVDLWDLVLNQQEGKGLSRGEMDANASLFMIAGTETTATLVSGLTYLLLKHPDAMKKLVEELRGAFASSDDISMEAIAAFPYLNGCIKEALRVYPPVPNSLPRQAAPEGSTVCGKYVPPGFVITVPHLAMYTSERLFKEPLSFIPERWTGDERFADDNRGCLQPFSVGSRDCLGKNMAYHEMRLIIAKTFYNFDLELCPESENWIDQETYSLWQKTPLLVKLRNAF